MIVSDQESFEARFASLEQASRNLSTDVRGLIATLQVVNDLQREQREQAIRQEAQERAISLARQAADEREARTRKAVRSITGTLALLLPAVSILVYFALLQHVDDLIQQNNAATFASCNIRNASALASAKREELLGAAETNPNLKKIHEDSAGTLRTSRIDCSKWAPK